MQSLLRWYYYSDLSRALCYFIADLLTKKDQDLSRPESYLMSQVAVTDYLNYLRVRWGLIGKRYSDYKLLHRLENEIYYRYTEFTEDLENWLDFWLVKWRQRVKLVFTDEELERATAEIHAVTENVVSRLRSELELVKERLLPHLIRVLEICFTNVILDGLVRTELRTLLDEFGSEDEVVEFVRRRKRKFFRRLVEKVRRLPQVREPLVILRVDTRILCAESTPEVLT